MSKISEMINSLKERRNKLEVLKKEQELKRMNNDIGQFYEDSLKLSNISTGMAIIIKPDNEYREFVPTKISHKKICQEIFERIGEDIDFDSYDGDFGEMIAKERNSIFIRVCSIANGSTIIYFPEHCNDYQIERLEQFNKEVIDYNSRHDNHQLATFEYDGQDDSTVNYDISQIIDYLKKNKSNEYK